MKIVEHSRAPSPRRVRIFLAEKGITVRYEQVDLAK
jgi:glutathione S-transferase